MKNLPANLISSSDVQTWKFDQPNVFLHHWNIRDTNRQLLRELDFKVAPSIYNDLAQQEEEYRREREIEKTLFPKLCTVLNLLHGTSHSERFWQIVIGHWFRRYVHLVFYKVRSLEVCVSSFNIASSSAFASESGSLVVEDSISFNQMIEDDESQDALMGKIWDVLNFPNISIDYVKTEKQSKDFRKKSRNRPPTRTPKELIIEIVRKCASLLVRESDAFIINSYLPLHRELLLSLSLPQVPQWWISPKLDIEQSADLELREVASEMLNSTSIDNAEIAIKALLFELLPLCYLEGFSSNLRTVGEIGWPKRPKFIFTSNNFDTDEVFKLWAAQKVESGVKYFVGQHGNNFGTTCFENPTIEEASCDYYITWGWVENSHTYIPAFNFKTVGKLNKKVNSDGNLLLVEVSATNGQLWDRSSFDSYFNDQIAFTRLLDHKVRADLIVRLYQPVAFPAGNELKRWEAFDKNIELDSSSEFWELSKRCKLLVFSYDSTGILEALAINQPFIAFWPNGLNHLRGSAKPFYEQMIAAGIFHLNPESAARKVNEIWDDIDSWWMSETVLEAREIFKSKYTRTSKRPIRVLRRILMENL